MLSSARFDLEIEDRTVFFTTICRDNRSRSDTLETDMAGHKLLVNPFRNFRGSDFQEYMLNNLVPFPPPPTYSREPEEREETSPGLPRLEEVARVVELYRSRESRPGLRRGLAPKSGAPVPTSFRSERPRLAGPGLHSVKPYDRYPFLAGHRLFTVDAGRGVLPRNLFPSHSSRGLFSYDGETVLLLNGLESLSILLRQSGKPLESYPLFELADLFQTVLIKEGQQVLERPEQLKEQGGAYQLNGFEYRQVAHRFQPLELSREGASWNLKFTCLMGWKHILNEVNSYSFTINDQFQVRQTSKRQLSKKVYDSCPNIRY